MRELIGKLRKKGGSTGKGKRVGCKGFGAAGNEEPALY